VFKLPNPDYSPVSVYFDFSQSTANPEAWPDGDFEETIPSEVFFEEGQDSLTVHITPVNDGLPEGEELLKIIVEYTLTCMPKYDTIEIIISDYIDMDTQTRPDTAICQGDDLELWVNVENGIPDYTFEWEGLPYTNDTITVNPNISTWYYVNVIDNCQDTVTDSIYVEVIPFPEVYLGNDTTICSGDEIILQAPFGNYTNYFWSTGDTSSSIIVADSGIYTLTVFNACGQAEDDVMVNQWPYPDAGLGPDLYLCFGETEVLNAAFGFVSYTWHDNSTDDYYIVTQGGLYTVTVEDINGCLGSDTVFAVVGGIVQLEDSLTLCEGETTTIHAGSGFNTYTWSTGQTGTDSITVNEEGWYKVNASYVFGCPSEDSTYVEAVSVPEAEISGSDLLCEGDTLWLVAPEGKYAYYWNDEQGSDEYMVTSGGTYNLKMINACGEDEESKVVQLSPLPMVDLGEDKLLLPGESVTLDAGNFQAFIWNNDPGQTGQYYTIAYEDIQELDSIWVEVFDGFCKNSDDIIIEVFSVDVPNVITPNGDGFNDRFMPGEGWSGISNHTIMVFNRWGEKVWESSDFSSGWDGKNNGCLVANGTYFWILEVWYGKKDIKKVYKGSLTVLGSDN
ncbi:MAG: gliding motility-associated C-terminal domain-containing protein, partial [Bacteroidales bacterium]|nr:gliding motility-associated C-terminal domain-containing protein [Bacteroidales bacterium]